MAHLLKNKLFALVAFIAALTSLHHTHAADYCAQQPVCCPPVCCEDDCEFTDWWVRGDLLCWTMREQSFIGTRSISDNSIDGISFSNTVDRINDLKFNWNLGFRVGAGYNYPCDDWDVAIYWTNFRDKTKKHKCDHFVQWRLIYNTVDAVMGYRYFFEPCFSIKPFLGVRYAQIDQKLKSILNVDLLVFDDPETEIITDIKHADFWGIGPQIGFDANWRLGCGWSVYATLAGNFMYGEFRIKNFSEDDFVFVINDRFEKIRRRPVQMGLDAGLGLRWDINIATLQIGLEHHRYFDFNQILEESLDLFGANASVTFHF